MTGESPRATPPETELRIRAREADRWGVRPEDIQRTPAVGGGSYLEIRPGYTPSERQARNWAARVGIVEERLVSAALGWPREVRVPVKVPGGRQRPLDVADVEARINIELDGMGHMFRLQMEADARRDAALRSAGWTVLRYGNGVAIDELDLILHQVGIIVGRPWTGPTRPVGSREDAYGEAATEELELVVREVGEHLAGGALIPHVLGDGIIAYWLPASGRTLPIAYLFCRDAWLRLTFGTKIVATRLMPPGTPRPQLDRMLGELGLTLRSTRSGFQLGSAFLPVLDGVRQALDRSVLTQAALWMRSTEHERMKALGQWLFDRFGASLRSVTMTGSGARFSVDVRSPLGGGWDGAGICSWLGDIPSYLLGTSATNVDRVELDLYYGTSMAGELAIARERPSPDRLGATRVAPWEGWIAKDLFGRVTSCGEVARELRAHIECRDVL